MQKIEPAFRESLVDYLRKNHSDICRHWFDDIEPSEIRDGVLRLVVREPVQLRYLQRCCGTHFTEAAQNVSGRLLVVRFVSPDDDAKFDPRVPFPANGSGVSAAHRGDDSPDRPAWLDEQMLLSPDYNFDSFVVGPGNRLAHAAAQAVAAQPGRAYNPYFIHGGVGLGKTHLLHAVCQELLRAQPSLRLCYISCNSFMDLFHEAVRAGRMNDFRNRFRTADVLVIDDIHFLSKREQTQEEFFHTFNELFNNAKQIVLASDRPPGEMKNLENRLVSRFEWGLTTQIQTPDFETRVAILSRKMHDFNVSLEPWILEFIAHRIRANVRKLEGALMRVAAHVSLEGTMSSESALAAFLHDVIDEEPTKSVTVDRVQRAVATQYDLRVSDLTGPRRPKNIAEARQVAMYLTRHMVKLPLIQIGEEFGGRDHGTVIHACKVISRRMNETVEFRSMVDRLNAKLLEA